MKILVLTSCTGDKKFKPDNQLTMADFEKIGSKEFKQREKELGQYKTKAQELYTGLQHQRLMQGVSALNNGSGKFQVDLKILSAGYGIISGNQSILPYECTFQGMKSKVLTNWANHLNVPADIRTTLAQPYDLGLVLLGDAYLKACGLDEQVVLGGPTIMLCGTLIAKRLPQLPLLKKVTLSNPEAKRFSCALIGLKGELASRLLCKLANNPEAFSTLKDTGNDILGFLDGRDKKPLSTLKTCVNPKVDQVISIPQMWWDKPHRNQLRYFIPEWDDLVDPDYDFLNDVHSGGRGDWSNEVYAHQMYPDPNYDGILMSRAVAEKSKKKKERINRLGVHRFLRVPREFPIMGDCGAFDYIMEETPPYTTEDVIDYYTRLGFDFGVSVDHLIVTATESQKKFRYELTIHNAEEFIKAHRNAGLNWTPVGAVQGWDPKSYASAAAQYVKMGYQYIGLGGLVRTSTPEILTVLREVHDAIPKGIGVHLFGLARLKVIHQMAELGVTSVDSASALRRAWLGGKDNYWDESGNHYRAIRIPEAGKSFRAKRMVSEGRASADFVAKIERECMRALRAYDNDKLGLKSVLDTIGEYDHLITPDRTSLIEEYGRTLEERPWKQCACDICHKDGIDVIIFRGNNRNRRRGFHNTYIFYRLLQKVLDTGDASFLDSGYEAADSPKQMKLF